MPIPRVLVIDDDPSFPRMVFRCLDRAGYDCLVAHSGAEGVAAALQRSPDLIVLDLRLPDVLGFGVMKQLRQDGRTASIPVIAITGAQDAGDLLGDAASSLDACAFLRKPVALNVLLRTVARALGDEVGGKSSDPWFIERGPLRIDLRRRVVLIREKALKLGPRRFDALCALARSKDGLSGKVLRTLVWGGKEGSLNTMSKAVNRLRRDLERACGQDMIVPMPGGYRLQ